MESKNYSDYTLQELCDLYTKYSQEGNSGEAQIIYEYILVKEKEAKGPVVTLASPGKRLGAVLIDGLIIVIPTLIVMFIFVFGKVKLAEINIYEYIVPLFIFPHVLYLLVNGYPLYNRGQTIGKIALDIKIVDLKNNKPSFVKIYLLRYLLNGFIGLVPFVGSLYGLADALFVFRDDRRCIHDLIAGTKVIVDESGE